MLKTIEFKLYPTAAQAETMAAWMRTCCWVYNRALEQRIKAYRRRGESLSLYKQGTILTTWRSRMPTIRACPVEFERDALRRVDRGMQAFFRRVKAKQKAGFPRFKSQHRYNSMEILEAYKYIRDGKCHIVKLGLVKFRAGDQVIPRTQTLLRVIRRTNGWFGQVLVEDLTDKSPMPTDDGVGVDVGLNTFATMSTGETIGNPRWGSRSTRKLRSAHRRISRRKKGSRNRRKAVRRLQRVHERVAAQRKDFCHQHSRRIVNRFSVIAFEKLNIKGLAKSHNRKSIIDAAWGIFLHQLTYKAECAGRQTVAVDPRGTSQTCPECGLVESKNLSERVHACPCGCVLDRDVAAARVILARALGSSRGVSPVEEVASVAVVSAPRQVAPSKQEGLVYRDSFWSN